MDENKEYDDSQKDVLEIRFEDGSKMYLASAMFMMVADPYDATRYFPVEEPDTTKRQEGRDRDEKWMRSSCEAEVSFVPYLDALKEFREKSA